jgi:signal transduction histidine kinase/CheY-like chemotaxis protein
MVKVRARDALAAVSGMAVAGLAMSFAAARKRRTNAAALTSAVAPKSAEMAMISASDAAPAPRGTTANETAKAGAPQTTSVLGTAQRERDAAVAANAAKSRYLANVSHEIRSPLNAIYGYAQLLERGAAIDTIEAARVIRRSAEHLTDLVEGLLDISLVENGVLRVSTDTVRLPAFIDQVGRMFRPAAESKGLVFRTEIVGHLPDYVRADQKRLRQALINLISNAIKYTQSGEVVLNVRYSAQIATFEVRDTGPGIATESQEAIFAPFDRGVEGARAGGIGLGLPITRAIIQILGGELDLESVPGKGSVFRVRVMLGQIVGHRDGPGEDVGTARRVATGYLGPRRSILVADDDPRQLAFVRQVLGDLDFDVVAAADGETVLAMARAQRFDLALLDIAMPGWSGWQTAAALRKLGRNDMRIVMLSANAHERHGSGDPTTDDAHDQFLVKPVEIDTMVDAIGDLLGVTWTFAPLAETDVKPDAVEPAETFIVPDAAKEHLDRLRDRVRIGHIRGIEAEIRAIEAISGKDYPLVPKLYDCLDRFDLSGLARLLERA